jgi:hypothetical protein
MRKGDPRLALWEKKVRESCGDPTWFGRIIIALGIPLYRFPLNWSYKRVRRPNRLRPFLSGVKFHWMTIAARIYARLRPKP